MTGSFLGSISPVAVGDYYIVVVSLNLTVVFFGLNVGVELINIWLNPRSGVG